MPLRLRNLTPAEFDELGRFCASLLSDEQPWVCRRKESITLLDEASLRRQQSVDFTLDAIDSLAEYRGVCDRVFGKGIYAAPLFILDKDPASSLAFDLKDESGRSLSLMTSEENGAISAATLKALCRAKLVSEGFTAGLPPSLAEKLEQLAKADASGGRDWLDRLKNPLPEDPDRREIDTLLERPDEDGELNWWLNTLAVASIVLVAFEGEANHRRVIKMSYEQPLLKDAFRLSSRLGWMSFQAKVRSSLIRSGRYHLEVKAPPDFRLTRVAMIVDRTKRYITAPGFRRRAQLYVDDVHDPRGANTQFAMRVSGKGVLGGALVAAALVVAAILACMQFSERIAEGSAGGPSLLLVLPGLIATYVAQSDQHGLTTRLLAIPRWILLLLAGVTAYYAAGMIALLGPVEEGLRKDDYEAAVERHSALIDQWLGYGAVAAALAVAVIGIAWICTRERTHQVWWWAMRKWRRYVKSRFDLHETLGMSPHVAWPSIEEKVDELKKT